MTQEQQQVLELLTHTFGASLAYISAVLLYVAVFYFIFKAIKTRFVQRRYYDETGKLTSIKWNFRSRSKH